MTKFVFEGKEYIKGLHGVPEYHKNTELNTADDWYWAKNSKKEDCYFLPYHMFEDFRHTK